MQTFHEGQRVVFASTDAAGTCISGQSDMTVFGWDAPIIRVAFDDGLTCFISITDLISDETI